MESQPGEGSPAPSEASGAEPLPTRIPWVRIVAVVLAVILVVTALALLNRHPNRAPTMTQVSAKPVAPEAGAEVTFTVQAADPDGDDLSYSWDLGDGTTGTGDLPPHVYSNPGKFIVFVAVADGKGGVATNEANLTRVDVKPKATDIAAPSCPASPNRTSCALGPLVAVLDADRWTAGPSDPIAFYGNLSWAYTFAWNDSTNHSKGGIYALDVAWRNASLFDRFLYVWGDGAANATGPSDRVGNTTHVFTGLGSFFVRLTVTYRDPVLGANKSATAGFTVRTIAPLQAATTYAPWPPLPNTIAARSASRP